MNNPFNFAHLVHCKYLSENSKQDVTPANTLENKSDKWNASRQLFLAKRSQPFPGYEDGKIGFSVSV